MSRSGDCFKRPMEYCPEVALIRTPQQCLMKELGLEDDDIKDHTSSSGSDSDDSSPPHRAPVVQMLSRSPQHELKDVKQMLRETQHKLRAAQCNLAESEHNKERRLKILRKTHQSAVSLKQALVQELQDIILEKDEYIGQLEARLKNGVIPTSPLMNKSQPGILKRLVEQISRLHREITSLESKNEHASEDLHQLRAEKERLQDELYLAKETPLRSPMKSVGNQLGQQVKELQQKVLRLERERETALSRTNTEKELQIQVVDLQAQLRGLQMKHDVLLAEKNKASTTSAIASRLEGENTTLRAELAALRSEIETLVSNERQAAMRADSLRRTLEKEKETAANATEEKEQLQKMLLEAQSKAAQMEDKVSGLMSVVGDLESSVGQLHDECRQYREQLHSLKHTHSKEVEHLQEMLADKQLEFENEQEQLQQRYLKMQSKLESQETSHYAALQVAEEKGRSEASGAIRRMTELKESLSQVHCSAVSSRRAIVDLKDSTLHFSQTVHHDIATACRKICYKISDVSNQNVALVSKYRREMQLRKRLHNQLVELRGNIRVFCRVRPPIEEDGGGAQASVVVELDRDDDGVVHVLSRGSKKPFEMDRVFGCQSTQEEVFNEVKPLVTSCMDGYNVCIFAYGQTGSGKTFTMEGPSENPGINQRTLAELFGVVEEREKDFKYTIVVSVLEIYNECVRDLLSLTHTEKLEIKQGPEGVYVPGLTQVEVSCLEEVNEVFALGHENRATGATKMNIQSSRSHALLCVTVMGINNTTGIKTMGKLNLIDLAGSERLAKSGSDGTRLQEAKHINKSLSALGDVIHSLRAKSQHTPYRNSKLTYLLQDSLGGDSKTLMVVQVAPVEKNAGETVCSLNFAQRVRAVELGAATKKVFNPYYCQGSPRPLQKFQ